MWVMYQSELQECFLEQELLSSVFAVLWEKELEWKEEKLQPEGRDILLKDQTAFPLGARVTSARILLKNNELLIVTHC